MNDFREAAPHLPPPGDNTLFLGESPPHGGTFFYKQDSLLYHRMKEFFGAASNFLPAFQANGFFLDDLVLYPTNSGGYNVCIYLHASRRRHRHRGGEFSCLFRKFEVSNFKIHRDTSLKFRPHLPVVSTTLPVDFLSRSICKACAASLRSNRCETCGFSLPSWNQRKSCVNDPRNNSGLCIW